MHGSAEADFTPINELVGGYLLQYKLVFASTEEHVYGCSSFI